MNSPIVFNVTVNIHFAAPEPQSTRGDDTLKQVSPLLTDDGYEVMPFVVRLGTDHVVRNHVAGLMQDFVEHHTPKDSDIAFRMAKDGLYCFANEASNEVSIDDALSIEEFAYAAQDHRNPPKLNKELRALLA